MKLSEMNTNQLADCLLTLTDSIANIAEDEKVLALIESLKGENIMKMNVQMAITVFRKILPIALADHRSDVFGALAALTGKSVKQIATQNAMLTIREAYQCFDKDLIGFFTSLATTDAGA